MDENKQNREDNKIDRELNSEEDEYRFLRETQKQPPMKMRTIWTGAALIVIGAVLFGVIAAEVFVSVVNDRRQNTPDTVQLSEDEDLSQSDSESSVSSTAPAVEQEEHDQAAETPKTDEEMESDALVNYELLNRKMTEIGTAAERYLVRVSGITSQEDWLKNTDTSATTATGLIVADNGKNLLILTDYSSIDGAEQIAVTFSEGTILNGTLVKNDPITNLAVISVADSDLTEAVKSGYSIAVLGNSYQVSTGDSVIAIGSPLGYIGSIGYGEVTSTDNTVSVTDGEYSLITTSIQGSSSGNGVLINTDGEVVGIIFQKYSAQNQTNVTGVPISLLKHRIEVLSNNGTLSYAGFKGLTVTEKIAESSGMPEGVYVTAVDADSPALQAGLAVGDVIQGVDGLEITSMKLLHTKLNTFDVGDTVSVTVRRLGADGYKKFEFKLTIGELK